MVEIFRRPPHILMSDCGREWEQRVRARMKFRENSYHLFADGIQ